MDKRANGRDGGLVLRHYAAEVVAEIRSTAQREHPDMKPRGFWLSVDSCDDNWPSWCERETFSPARLAVVHDVTLSPTANILMLSGASDLLEFTNEYRQQAFPNVRDYFGIDWQRVSQKHQGIIITPYVWSMRLDHRLTWYYGWDCASGCVWDAAAIASVTVQVQAPQELAA